MPGRADDKRAPVVRSKFGDAGGDFVETKIDNSFAAVDACAGIVSGIASEDDFCVICLGDRGDRLPHAALSAV